MAFRDLRGWISKLEQEGELKRVTSLVDWDKEIGAITRKTFDIGGPALLFENIKDYQKGRCTRLFTGGLGAYSRVAYMLGLPKDTPMKEMVRATRERFASPIKPIEVSSGPVKENIVKGKDINMLDFPVPQWHRWDGGRYCDTTCGVVTRNPDTGIVNVGTYRGMVAAKDKIAKLMLATAHWAVNYNLYKARGEAMPVAIIYGWEPALNYVACTPVSPHVCEYDVMGGIRQAPVELVKCETSDLLVPASAEIVVEGTISPNPDDFMMEGPFGEYPGYFAGVKSPKPTVAIKCITHRNDPIFRGSLEGFGPGHPNESKVMSHIACASIAYNIVKESGVPGVLDLTIMPASCFTNAVIQIKKQYVGHAKQVAMALWGSNLPSWLIKNVVVVEEDIDIYDLEAIEWAIAYRVNPGSNDIVIIPGTPGNPLDPSVPAKERDVKKLGTGKWNRMIIDATQDWEFDPQEQYGGDRYPPVCFILPPEEEQLVLSRWKEYGIEPVK